MSVAKKNERVKALQSFMASAKKADAQTELEWEMTFNTNGSRNYKVYSQELINELYDRYNGNASGATKVCHTRCHNGSSFQYIVVKRFKEGGWCPAWEGSGNQLIDEIDAWNRFADKTESDFLCPVLKYFKSKSDKVSARSEKMRENVVIIAQKAVYVSDCWHCCKEAYRLNQDAGIYCEGAQERYDILEDFADKMSWRDVMENPGNCGVIYDYSQKRYKAVFIDYAL